MPVIKLKCYFLKHKFTYYEDAGLRECERCGLTEIDPQERKGPLTVTINTVDDLIFVIKISYHLARETYEETRISPAYTDMLAYGRCLEYAQKLKNSLDIAENKTKRDLIRAREDLKEYYDESKRHSKDRELLTQLSMPNHSNDILKQRKETLGNEKESFDTSWANGRMSMEAAIALKIRRHLYE